jgi:hypothetical protein
MANKILEFLKKEQEDKPMCSFESEVVTAKLGERVDLGRDEESKKSVTTQFICAINENELDKVELAFFKRP